MKRLLPIALGYLLAVLTAGAILTICAYWSMPRELREAPGDWISNCLFAFVLSVLPSGLLIWAAERLRVRALWLHGLGGVLVAGAAVALLFTNAHAKEPRLNDVVWAVGAGIVAGSVYWRIAGRRAEPET